MSGASSATGQATGQPAGRAAERARGLLARPGAWIEATGGENPTSLGGAPYLVRLEETRRARVTLRLDEAAFLDLVARPGLVGRPAGGWRLRPTVQPASAPPAPGRPGLVPGARAVMEADGRLTQKAANLACSPLTWLASRKDASGRPWLTPAEVAAGERLRRDAERAGAGPSVTMRWDALPRQGGGSGLRIEPGDRALSASARVEAALAAVGPRLRPFLVQTCLNETSLTLAEAEFGLRRRQGRIWLKQGLQALAEHYGVGR